VRDLRVLRSRHVNRECSPTPLQLTRPERARIAEELRARLGDPDEVVAEAWAQELERRSRELEGGSVVAIPWEEVRDSLMAELEARRAAF
jgi:putative addiction module component (TIGR02574 family)